MMKNKLIAGGEGSPKQLTVARHLPRLNTGPSPLSCEVAKKYPELASHPDILRLLRQKATITAARKSGFFDLLGGLNVHALAARGGQRLADAAIQKLAIKGAEEWAEHVVPYLNVFFLAQDIWNLGRTLWIYKRFKSQLEQNLFTAAQLYRDGRLIFQRHPRSGLTDVLVTTHPAPMLLQTYLGNQTQ